MKKLIAVTLGVLIVGCCDCTPKDQGPEKPVKREEIVRLFVHTPGYYTGLKFNHDTKELESVKFGYNNHKLFCDVPKDKPMYYEDFKQSWETRIHIHSINEVDGGGWDAGKGGAGKETVIE